MPPKTDSDLVAIERAAIVTAALVRGGTVTITEVARLAECTERHAYRLLSSISRVINIVDDEGLWFVAE